MINVFTLTNINTKITEGNSEVCIKLVALRIHRYTRSSFQFQKRLVTPGLDLYTISMSCTEPMVPAEADLHDAKEKIPCSKTFSSVGYISCPLHQATYARMSY